MSGGIAYVLRRKRRVCRDTLQSATRSISSRLEDAKDMQTRRDLIARHLRLTGSPRANWILDNWPSDVAEVLESFSA